MKILISGGNFINKGAEAMLFTTVNECLHIIDKPEFILQLPNGFVRIKSIDELVLLSNHYIGVVPVVNKLEKFKTLINAYRSADIMLDVSGLELSSKLGTYPSLRYLFKIAIAKLCRTQVFLMPQSFGPFNYGKGLKQCFMKLLIRHFMRYPTICFAREKDGCNELKAVCKKAKVLISNDIVLQNKSVESLLRRTDMGIEALPDVKERSIGFIPNKRLYEQYGKTLSSECYLRIISEVLRLRFNVYLVCHAIDDMQIAKEIKQQFNDDPHVIVVGQILSCFQYQALAGKFDFVVASRYHSIVHAYKGYTPTIAIGWAVKYQELLLAFRQESYLVGITATNEEVSLIINKMASNYKQEKEIIKSELIKIQKTNCFDILSEYIK